MTSTGNRASTIVVLCVALATTVSVRAQSSKPQALYNDARARELTLRRQLMAYRPGQDATELLRRLRTLAGAYEDMARLFPSRGYSENALWQGAKLEADAFWEIGEATDRALALRLFEKLRSLSPSSPLGRQASAQVKRLSNAPVLSDARPATPQSAPRVSDNVGTSQLALLTAIRREQLPDVLRFTLEFEREAPFRSERLDGPPRVFVDLRNTRTAESLKDVVLSYPDDAVRQVRVGRHADGRTRVVLDLQRVGRHSVYALYNPYRIVIDFERSPEGQAATRRPVQPAPQPPVSLPPAAIDPNPIGQVREAATEVPTGTGRADDSAPSAPSANKNGGFSLSRQLGLGISRVVLDPGHGGHDPGTKISGLTEADLVLDVALRLEKLLLAQPGVEVVLTRRANTFVPLEERTDIANRSNADLFLSIHVNASESSAVRGVETYYLNFAPNAAAEEVAARENAGSARTMRNLPEFVRAIALNDKIDESRDFATMVQGKLYDRLLKTNRVSKNLGVKQAPFVVLIGAKMPSALAEVAFMTNRQDASLLKTEKYRQQIAEALLAGIQTYQQSLKKAPVVAAQ